MNRIVARPSFGEDPKVAAKIDKSEDEQVTIKEASEYAKSIKAELH